MTRSRQLKLAPWLRVCAALALFFWLAAWTVCTTECHAEGADQMGQMATPNGQSHDSDKNDHHDDSFCISLHSFSPQTPDSISVKPNFTLTFTLDFLATAHLAAVAQTETLISRQPPDREFVFTPEVSLGAAFRSLAPPVLA